MDITHRVIKNNIYIYINIVDKEEFSKEFLNTNSNKSLISKLKRYVNKYFSKDAQALLLINGVLVGTVSLGIFFKSDINKGKINLKTDTYISNDIKEENNTKNENNIEKDSVIEENIKTIDNPDKINILKIEDKTTTEEKNNKLKENNKKEEVTKPPVINNGITINLKTNGIVSKINLEKYVIGVVASEMPALFNSEALKAQAVTARTFAMDKYSKGITLINSTSHQVYKNENQLRKMWRKFI